MSIALSSAAASVGPLRGVRWQGQLNGHLVLLDQTRLPSELNYLQIEDLPSLRQAILDLAVRGAPAIGISAAYGLILHLRPLTEAQPDSPSSILEAPLQEAYESLRSSRPTAVNLHWALQRQQRCFEQHQHLLKSREMLARLLLEARRIEEEDVRLCDAIARHGAALLPASGGVYTHCNTGRLATAGVGTALGCIRRAWTDGKRFQVYAGETRPLLQGARLTATELHQEGIPVQLCCDSTAGSLMQRGLIQAVIVGADRITARGDTANKIGTYSLAVLARHHDLPFFVAAPYSTFDLDLEDGAAIVIEERSGDEIRRPQGSRFAADEIAVCNPAFDVTPAELITAIITEAGIVHHPDCAGVRRLLQSACSDRTPSV